MSKVRIAYVHGKVGRDGRLRYYFRRKGHPLNRTRLPGLPGSPEFMTVYQSCLAGEAPTVTSAGSGKTRSGTISAAIVGYTSTPDFGTLAPRSRLDRRRILERLRIEHGDKSIATIQKHHIERIIAAKPTPSTALHLLVALREVMRYAVKMGMRPDDPTTGIRRPRYRPGNGLHTWTEEEIAKFEARWPVGTTERLAMALGIFTGQRRSDVIKMGRQHLRDGTIFLTQQKTGTPLVLPIHPALKIILDKVPAGQLVFLHSAIDRPFGVPGFAGWFRRACRKAGLPDEAGFHGLRKAAARRLAEAGASANVIAAVTGHRTLTEVSRYTQAADQARLAKQGMSLL